MKKKEKRQKNGTEKRTASRRVPKGSPGRPRGPRCAFLVLFKLFSKAFIPFLPLVFHEFVEGSSSTLKRESGWRLLREAERRGGESGKIS